MERQAESTQRYIEKHNLVVVREYEDRGVSGFRGKNARVGELKLILDAIDSGLIRNGEHLVIENVDRLTRQPPSDAHDLVKAILKRGVTIHSTLDGSILTAESLNELPKLVGLILSMSRGYEESKLKSDRVSDRYRQGRKTGAIVSGRIPSWLMMVKHRKTGAKHFEVNGLAIVVNDIFEWSAGGLSSYKIAMKLREAGIKPFGEPRARKGSKAKDQYEHEWNATSVLDLIRGRAVLGEFRSHTISYDPETGQRRDTLAAILPDYYIPIVSPDLWRRANDACEMRKKTRVRGAVGTTFTNLLKGAAVCAHCHRSMQIKVQKETRDGSRYTRLRCAGKNEGVCDNSKSPRLLEVEEKIVRFVSEIDIRDNRSEERAALDKIVATQALQIEQLTAKAERIAEELDGTRTALKLIQGIESQIDALEASLSDNRSKLGVLELRETPKDRQAAFEDLQRRMALAEGDEALFELRAQMNLRIRQVIEKATFDREGVIGIHMVGSDEFYVIETEGRKTVSQTVSASAERAEETFAGAA